MLRSVAAVAGLMLLSGAAAPSGEKPGPLTADNNRVRWEEAQQYAARASLVVVGRVVEAGRVSGQDWNARLGAINGRTPVDIRQELVVEPSEILRGRLGPGKLTVRIRGFGYSWFSMLAMNENRVPVAGFALVRDRTYLFFLAEPGTEAGQGEGCPDRLVAEPAVVAPAAIAPVEEPEAHLLASVRAWYRALADWRDPPKLGAEEEARVRELVADLGSDDFGKREEAQAELRRVGVRAKPHIEAAAKDPDPERSFRAGELLELLKATEPLPGRTELPGGPGQAPGPDVIRRRPPPRALPRQQL